MSVPLRVTRPRPPRGDGEGRSGNLGQGDARYKFTGKERDAETGYDYFGARYYDAKIGRFTGIDRFADKYPSLSPYQYTANDPIRFVDANGDSVVTADREARRSITLGIPKGLRQSVQFDGKGELQVAPLFKVKTTDINFNALRAVAMSPQKVLVDSRSTIIWKEGDGTSKARSMKGFTGFTATPMDPHNAFLSTIKDVIHVQLNNTLSRAGMAAAAAHEIYGHALFYIEGKDFNHHPIPGTDFDSNRELIRATSAHEEDALRNAEDK